MKRRTFIQSAGAAAALSSLLPFQSFSQSSVSPIAADTIKKIRGRISPVTIQEYAERQERARSLMSENNIDALLMEGGSSLNYFTGIEWRNSERIFVMILPKKGDAFFIVPAFEEGRAREQCGKSKIYTWQEQEIPYLLIKKIMNDRKMLNANLGLEEKVRYFVVDNLQKTISSMNLQNASPVTAGCRSMKTPHEIELMQIANDITAEVYKAAVSELKEGMGEQEFGNIVTRRFAEFGVNGAALVLFGEASAYPHGLIKESKLKENNIVLIDGGCAVEGYESDITRTTVFGKASERMNKIFDIVSRAQEAALDTAKPGAKAESIDAAARKVISDAGFGNNFSHRLGHGIGMDEHEWYYLVKGNDKPVKAGNVFSNEPGIYLAGEFGIRIEDEMLITENGAKLLLPPAKSLEKMF